MTEPLQRAGTITLGGTAQTFIQESPTRAGFFIQNLSNSQLFIRDGANATGGAADIKIPVDSLYESPSNSPVGNYYTIYGDTTSQAFTYKQW